MDIEIEHHRRGTPPRLDFEAKRIGPSHGVRNSLGEEGLLAFINGYDSTTHGEAGVLGYVQSKTTADWHQHLAAALISSPTKYHSRIASHSLHTGAGFAVEFCSDYSDNIQEFLMIHPLLPFF